MLESETTEEKKKKKEPLKDTVQSNRNNFYTEIEFPGN